jgi:hypothetical protein
MLMVVRLLVSMELTGAAQVTVAWVAERALVAERVLGVLEELEGQSEVRISVGQLDMSPVRMRLSRSLHRRTM